MKMVMKGSEERGVYAVYWELERDNNSFPTTRMLIPPKEDDTPNEIKLMILEELLKDLEIPIRIEDHLIRRKV